MNRHNYISMGLLLAMILFTAILPGCHDSTATQKDQAGSGNSPMNMPMAAKNTDMANMPMEVMPGATDSSVLVSFILRPTNEWVRSDVPLTSLQFSREAIEVAALGRVDYDTRRVGSLSARISGRIEKLYVRYRYQPVRAGQRIMDLYSPEILTAEQNLLFLLKSDSTNAVLIQATRQKLLFLGMSQDQLDHIIQTRQPELTIAVYSPYAGHIHEAGSAENMPAASGASNGVSYSGGMRDLSLITEALSLKEGMYVQKGQTVFTVYDPGRAWVLLQFYPEDQALVHVGNPVRVIPETSPEKAFGARVEFIEPFYRKEDKTLTARVYFDNRNRQIPIGSQVNATISGNIQSGNWLPEAAIVSLGLDKVVFMRSSIGFRAHRITTGIIYNHKIQVLEGLTPRDTVAANAQYLMDSESFIKVKE